MPVAAPEKYKVRSPRKKEWTVEAMRFDSSNANAMAVYQWIEQNSAGSFDVNSPEDPIPTSGVSIDAATGHMVIATKLGIVEVNIGDWVVRHVGGEFMPFTPEAFHDTYVKA